MRLFTNIVYTMSLSWLSEVQWEIKAKQAMTKKKWQTHILSQMLLQAEV